MKPYGFCKTTSQVIWIIHQKYHILQRVCFDTKKHNIIKWSWNVFCIFLKFWESWRKLFPKAGTDSSNGLLNGVVFFFFKKRHALALSFLDRSWLQKWYARSKNSYEEHCKMGDENISDELHNCKIYSYSVAFLIYKYL